MPSARKPFTSLSHGGKYYHRRPALENSRKRRESARLGSSALALVALRASDCGEE